NGRAGGKLLDGVLHFLAFFFLALDIDLPAQQFGREAHVLPLLANGERKLGIVDNHFHVMVGGVDNGHPADLGGAEGVGGKLHRVLGKFDDVDFFAAQFADDGLHAHTLHADARAHAVHIAVAAGDGDLGALAGLAGTAADGHRAIVNLRHFLFKETLHQFAVGARNHYARAFGGFIDNLDHAAHAVAHAVTLEAGLLALRQAGFGLAEIDYQIQPFHALDGGIHQLAHAIGVFAVNGFALGFAYLLKDDLLGGLRGDAPQRVGRLLDTDGGADFRQRIDAAGFAERHFEYWVGNGIGHYLYRVKLDGSGLVFEIGLV